MWIVGALVTAQVATATPTTLLERFAGSRATAQVTTTVATLAPDLQLTHNPYVETSLLLLPRLALGEDWTLSAQLALGVEWTNSDTTDLRNEVELSDLTVGVSWRGLPEVLGVATSLRAELTLPLAEATRASTLIVAPAISAAARRSWALFDGELSAGASALYRRPLYAFTTPGVDVPRSYSPQCFGGAIGCAEQLTGVANARDVVAWGLELSGAWRGFTPGLAWRMTHVVPYGFADVPSVERLDARTALRVSTYFAAWVGYGVTDTLGVELGYQMSRNVLDGDGTLGNPIFDRYQDARLYLGVTYTL